MEQNKIGKQLADQIRGGNAFIPLEKMLNMVSAEQAAQRPEGLPYSIYMQLYHLRMAQKDIIDYCSRADYKPMQWPDDYWPDKEHPPNEEDWKNIQDTFFEERNGFVNYISDEKSDLLAPVRSNGAHTLLREALLILEHNSYHTGQILIIMRLLGIVD